ncbi:hypothetical protein ABT160_15790 [Streptomyces sp. NPDC001941]|uniref:hypothetical protein n=1 Tax=Streptomyces sp. NPDC001941 TaxID=3154659 RepID=UPI003333D4B4
MNAVSVLATIALPVLAAVALVVCAWRTVRGVADRSWTRPGWWPNPAFVLLVAGAVIWFFGAWSGGLDVGEACAAQGTPLDNAYRAAHWREASRWFPLHNKCDAAHDLVPAYVNPTLVAVAVLLVGCAVAAVAAVLGRKKSDTTA